MATRAMDTTSKRNPALARFADRVTRGSDSWVREVGCALPQPAFATTEEVRYAHELRLQLRARFLNHIATPALPWSVGAD
ncbi:MAG: hypothetical protein ABW110_21220 [Steroidobacteraceae bacterium]